MHGGSVSSYAYNNWGAVLFSVSLFILFALGFLKPAEKVEWRALGVFFSFLVVLFTEMYGFPLTIFILTSLLGKRYPALNPFSHPSGHLLLVFLGLSQSRMAMVVLHLFTNTLILSGLYLLFAGWRLIYYAGEGELVKEGIYSRIRHPQYLGILLIASGFLIQWPSLTTLFMWPILILAYYKLAMREERELERQFGEEFLEYREKVPAFIPGLILKPRKRD